MAGQQAKHGRTRQGAPESLYGLVAIGASAGGIEALSTVLGALSADFPASIVVAQHLDPNRPSHLDDILARRTPLTVRQVSDVAKLEPGTVYVVPSDCDVEITDHEMRARPSAGALSIPSVNRLLSSAARAYGERLIAVILTGSGSDGAEGAREVKAAGGMVVIEDPATAAFPSMPRSLAPTTVDIAIRLDQIGPLLTDLMAGAFVPQSLDPDHPGVMATAVDGEERTDEAAPSEDGLLEPLLAHLRDRSGIDFTGYRRPTILRRLQRRMAATKSPRLADYQRYLARHPDEYQYLISSFLIKVTEFFRDPAFFRVLRERTLPELIAYARTQDNQLRLWSAGCATGEEAYSLAILVAEALGPELSQFTVRLFATDLDERAVAFARQGVYPATALASVPEELRSRYFTPVDGAYEVKKVIRSLITFGEHDLGQRPPFPHMDLVLCRNVLIYFTSEMQRRAMSLFAYALRPGGYLLLGKAESARALSDYFAPTDAELKLYRRVGVTLPATLLLQPVGAFSPLSRPAVRPAGFTGRRPIADGESVQARRASAGRPELAELERVDGWLSDEEARLLVLDLPVGLVIVDRRYHVHTINSVALRLLDIYRPAIGEDLVHLAERAPGPALRRLIDAVFHTSPSAERPDGVTEVVTLETGLGERRDVEITAYPHLPRARGWGARDGERAATARADTATMAILLLTDATRAVQARAAAELVAVHEQRAPEQALQRRDEDMARLVAQRDQAMAVNRELVTANEELGRANLDLQQVTDELLLSREQEQASTEEIRTLNEELQASNEEMETVNEELEATVEELRASNDSLEARTREVQELAATAEQKRQAAEAEAARQSAILLSLGDAILVVDPTGTPLLTNAAYIQQFGDAATALAVQDTEGSRLPYEATPQHRVARGETFVMEFTLDGDDGKRRYFEANGQPIRSEGKPLGGVLSIRDITERSLHRFQDEFLALASHELRTPLTPLYAYLQLLDKLLAEGPAASENARARDYVARSQEQVWRLRRLVQDMIDVRRLQQGGFALLREPVALAEIVTRCVEDARLITQSEQEIHPEIHLEIVETAPLIVEGDAMRLEQILMNLLTNAISYAPHSLRIVVRLQRDGNEATIHVHDQGAGIPAADLRKIFVRFYQSASGDERPSRRGLGLGLYIANTLVAAHGGRLEVASVREPAEGHGTTFTIRLPLAPDSAPEEASGQAAQASPGKGWSGKEQRKQKGAR